MQFIENAFERFANKTPTCVMARALLENTLSASHVDAVFEQYAVRQHAGELLFSTVADIMGQVVLRIHPSVNAAYLDRKEEIGVTVKSVYDKLKGIEAPVSRGLLRDTAARMKAIIAETGGVSKPLVAGYHTKIVDGNHLHRTDRRIGMLRPLNVAPLPGKALVVYDPQYRLAIDVLPCEDGHASERSLLPELLETVEKDDLWIADRNFCTISFSFAIAARNAKFIIRQHGNVPFKLNGERTRIGASETGMVCEQALDITDEQGATRTFRRITVELNEPTRDGASEIHILTNLPRHIDAIQIASLYRGRWTIETAFQEVAENLEGEIETLGYPKAALFGFCMALVTYNVFSVIRAAVHAVHGEEAAKKLSTYYVCHEISSIYQGMSVVLENEFWQPRYGSLTPKQMAEELMRLVRNIRMTKFKKNPWSPKKKPKLKASKQNRGHQSTHRILNNTTKKTPATT